MEKLFKGWNGERWTREYTLKEMLVQQLDNNGQQEVWVQSIGLRDKKGARIYEGDIVTNKYLAEEEVKLEGGGYYPFAIPGWEIVSYPKDVLIIGNIHQRKSLWKR